MRLLEVVTEHTGPFKTLFEVLTGMLAQVTIEFKCQNPSESGKNRKSEKNNNSNNDNDNDDEENEDDEYEEEEKKDEQNKDCMKIVAVDSSQTVLTNIKLEAKHFTKFICRKKSFSIGINLDNFNKLIKILGKNDIISLYIDSDDKNVLKIKIDNPEENKNSNLELKLLDLNKPDIDVPDTLFDAIITINSQEFHKLCREMKSLSDFLEIKCLSDKVYFSCSGDFSKRTSIYSTNDNGNKSNVVNIKHASVTNKKSPLIVQGIYELKNLVLFAKCASLCKDIQIYMKNNYPLVIKYTVATLGRVLLCLAPINSDATQNTTYSDEDELYNNSDNDADEEDD